MYPRYSSSTSESTSAGAWYVRLAATTSPCSRLSGSGPTIATISSAGLAAHVAVYQEPALALEHPIAAPVEVAVDDGERGHPEDEVGRHAVGHDEGVEAVAPGHERKSPDLADERARAGNPVQPPPQEARPELEKQVARLRPHDDLELYVPRALSVPRLVLEDQAHRLAVADGLEPLALGALDAEVGEPHLARTRPVPALRHPRLRRPAELVEVDRRRLDGGAREHHRPASSTIPFSQMLVTAPMLWLTKRMVRPV